MLHEVKSSGLLNVHDLHCHVLVVLVLVEPIKDCTAEADGAGAEAVGAGAVEGVGVAVETEPGFRLGGFGGLIDLFCGSFS